MTRRLSSLAVLIGALLLLTRAALPQEPVAGLYRINEPKSLVVISDPPGARIVKDGAQPVGTTPFAITLTRRGANGWAASVMLEAWPSDPDQCPQLRIIDNRELTPDTVEFFMRVCPSDSIRPDSVYSVEDITDPPIRLTSPPVRYPDILRELHIEGRAVVQLVVDTLGRPEPSSLRVVETTQQLFGPPAMEVVRASTFFPGHHQGRRVRVRVRMPVQFGFWRGQF